MKKLFAWIMPLLLVCFILPTGAGCQQTAESKTELSLNVSNSYITLENEKVRLNLNKDTGSINSLCNKERNLNLTKDMNDADVPAVRLSVLYDYKEQILTPTDFSYAVEKDNAKEKNIRLEWKFETGHKAIGNAVLKDGDDAVKFNIKIKDNSEEVPAYSVEYPIINDISTLDKKETDYFLSPFVTGYLFNNPLENFNGTFGGIGRTDGFYPSGWEYPMQFQAYYSQNKGGFYMAAEDGGTTLKSFTFVGNGDKLRASVWHYADKLGGDVNFDYDVSISNLKEGNWYEAAERYKAWGTQQKWCKEGLNENRTGLNKTFYEDTTLTNFCFLNDSNAEEAYKLMKEKINGKYLFITLSGTTIAGGNADNKVYETYATNAKTTNFYKMMKEYGDLSAMFEFPSFYRDIAHNDNQTFIDHAMKDCDLDEYLYYNWDEIYYEICPSCIDWTMTQLSKDQIYMEQADFSGMYHDVGFAVGLPKICCDSTHEHGKRINVLPEAIDQMKRFSKYARGQGGIYGQELISEQFIPYIDFYQTRANAGELSQMEAMRILNLIDNGSAQKLHLFEYIYGEYAGVRMDGYMLPESNMGGAYYHALAFTTLNGGISEYNFENTLTSTRGYPTVDDYDVKALEFMGKLAEARLTYGKEFLTYGTMVRNPEIYFGQTEYDYYVYRMDSINIRGQDYSGKTTVDNVVVSAFKYGGKIAVFLCNITEKGITSDYRMDVGGLYGVKSGNISCSISGSTLTVATIREGMADLKLNLPSREIVMLSFDLN